MKADAQRPGPWQLYSGNAEMAMPRSERHTPAIAEQAVDALLSEVEKTGHLKSTSRLWVTPRHLLLTIELRSGHVVQAGSAAGGFLVWMDTLGPSRGDLAAVVDAIHGICGNRFSVEHSFFRTVMSISRAHGGAPHRLVAWGHRGRASSGVVPLGEDRHRAGWFTGLLVAGYAASCVVMLVAGFTNPLLLTAGALAYVFLVALSTDTCSDRITPLTPNGAWPSTVVSEAMRPRTRLGRVVGWLWLFGPLGWLVFAAHSFTQF
ncbi:hypothetical protein [Aestuariimicrobium kwangyangense]|uniref:hypothetical protein n=1 Tax=Aestuariimicrobium kwangyangense TaxID=396389 RepID=UPI0003B396D7|nr:hypothetical protein [Aestuariimicrobium kwangyangense]